GIEIERANHQSRENDHEQSNNKRIVSNLWRCLYRFMGFAGGRINGFRVLAGSQTQYLSFRCEYIFVMEDFLNNNTDHHPDSTYKERPLEIGRIASITNSATKDRTQPCAEIDTHIR